MFGGFVLGAVVGALVVYLIIDPQGLKEKLLGVKDSVAEHAPSGEQTASAAATVWSFVKRNWLVLLIVVVLAVWGISSLIQQANQVPQVHLGTNNFIDKCGVSVNEEITREDVSRGYITVGSSPECRRTINLEPGKQAGILKGVVR